MSSSSPKDTNACWLCAEPAKQSQYSEYSGVFVTCTRCGNYLISDDLIYLNWPDPDIKPVLHLISGYSREVTAQVMRGLASGTPDWLQITRETLPAIRRQLPTTISERCAKLLLSLYWKTEYFGHKVTVAHQNDRTLAYAANVQEFFSLISLAESRNWISMNGFSGGAMVSLTAEGFNEVERLRAANIKSATAFVAMSFDKALTPWYLSTIEPAIARAGYRPVRIDFEEHSDQIVDRMLGEIRSAKFVVADFTQQKHGVYFEAGFAMGLGLPVIWLVREDDLPNCHFDTKQYNHLTWTDGDNLQERLYNRIRAIIGQGPLEP